MKCALVVVVDPRRQQADPRQDAFRNFLGTLEGRLPKDEPVTRLSDAVILFPLESSMHSFANTVHHTEQFPVELRILFLDEAPDWIELEFPPHPKQPEACR